ncbi:MAG: sulfite exporter TauE/SafE family protein [Halobacteria archaeon]
MSADPGLELLWLLPAGLLIGLASSMVGVGGGVFMGPLLALGFGFAPARAFGTSLGAMAPLALSSALAYRRQGHVKWQLALYLVPLAAAGGVLGAWATTAISPEALRWGFGLFVVAIGAALVLRPGGPKEDSRFKLPRAALAPLGLGVGFASGLLGIGGGVLMVPALMAVGLDIRAAVATSLLAILPTSLFGAGAHYALGSLALPHALLLAAGAIPGAQVGARLAARVSRRSLAYLLAAVLVYSAVRMWSG